MPGSSFDIALPRQSSSTSDALALASEQNNSYQRLSEAPSTLPARLGNLAKNFVNTLTSRVSSPESWRAISTLGLMLAAGAAGWGSTVAANHSDSHVDAMALRTQLMGEINPFFHPSYNVALSGETHLATFPNLTSAQPAIEAVTGDVIAQGQYAHDQMDVARQAYRTIDVAVRPAFNPNASSELENMPLRSLFEAARDSLSTQYGLKGLARWIESFWANQPLGRNIAALLNTTTPHDNFFTAKEFLGISGNASAPTLLTDCSQAPVALGPILQEPPYAGLYYASPAQSVWIPGRDQLPKVLGDEFARTFFNAVCELDNVNPVDEVFDVKAIAAAFQGRMNEVIAALDKLAPYLNPPTPAFNKTEFLQTQQQAFEILSANANISIASLRETVAKLKALDFPASKHAQLVGAGTVFAVGMMVAIAAKLIERQLQGSPASTLGIETPNRPPRSIELVELQNT